MRQESSAVRRDFLRRVGLGFVGLFAGTAATAAGPESRLFAELFLRDKRARQVPEGYYDSNSQLYHNAATRKPMFAAASEEPARRLSTEELLDLIQSGRFVDVSKNPLFGLDQMHATQAWSTLSRETTLSTTGPCCPIVTDSASDIGPDDTPSEPPR